jgi:hypothetical protein
MTALKPGQTDRVATLGFISSCRPENLIAMVAAAHAFGGYG